MTILTNFKAAGKEYSAAAKAVSAKVVIPSQQSATESELLIALGIAAAAHAGQKDRAGQPYALHPIRVMLTVKSSDERIAAVLHDTVEDTAITFEDLVDAGFSNDIVGAVQTLTKTAGESRIDAAKPAVQNSIANSLA